MGRFGVLVLGVLLLAGCGRDTDAPVNPPGPIDLSGTAYFVERMAMPRGSVLEVELVDEAGGQSIAVERIAGVSEPPFPFRLHTDTPWPTTDDGLLLQLTLYLPDGSPRFTAELSVDPQSGRLPAIRLQPVDYSEQDAGRDLPGEAGSAPELHVSQGESVSDGAPDWVSYQCGDMAVDARFDVGRLSLSLPAALVQLPSVQAASGARYGDGDIEFWTRGRDAASLILPDSAPLDCHRRDSLSPWTRAMLAGVDFRAVGNEPGWSLEAVHDGGHLSLVLDYGTHRLEFENIIVLDEGSGYQAESPGNVVSVKLTAEECADTMVDWTFPVQVTVEINEQRLAGCGRFLN